MEFWSHFGVLEVSTAFTFISSIFSFNFPADSIMALYAPKPQGSQPQMYGVPGGMYIAPQQHQQQQPPKAQLNQRLALLNRGCGAPPQGMPMGMGAPHQPGFMQQQQQQQQQASLCKC